MRRERKADVGRSKPTRGGGGGGGGGDGGGDGRGKGKGKREVEGEGEGGGKNQGASTSPCLRVLRNHVYEGVGVDDVLIE